MMKPSSTHADVVGSPVPPRLALKLALLGGSLLFSLIAVELFLRLINFAPDELHLFRANPNGTGSYRLRPNLDIVTTFGKANIPIKTNSHGMRWREVSLEGSTRKRVAFVGDSFTFGLWADTVEHSLAGTFEQEARGEFEALNFGVPGFGFTDIELLIREQVLQFRPACIVLMSYNGNDFLDTYLGLDRYSVTRHGVLTLNRELLERKIPAELRGEGFKFGNSLLEHLYVLRLLKAGMQVVARQDKSVQRAPPAADRSSSSNLFWSRKVYPNFSVEAKEVSLEALGKISELCRRNQIELRIVTVPCIEQVHFPELFGEDYATDLPQRYLEEFARSHAVPFLDLLPGLSTYALETKRDVYYRGDGHLNNEGHRVAGKLLASFLAEGRQIGQREDPQK